MFPRPSLAGGDCTPHRWLRSAVQPKLSMHSLVVALLLLLTNLPVGAAAQVVAPSIDVSVDPRGRYEIRSELGTFDGDIGHPLSNVTATDGSDALGAFHEVEFEYLAGSRSSAIRLYQNMVLFSTTYVSGGPNAEPFPVLSDLPTRPYTLSYRDTPFSPYQLNSLVDAADSPWLFSDATGSGFLISPAANFLNARMSLTDGTLSSGIDSAIQALPAGFTHQTLLVIGSGPDQLFDTW